MDIIIKTTLEIHERNLKNIDIIHGISSLFFAIATNNDRLDMTKFVQAGHVDATGVNGKNDAI